MKKQLWLSLALSAWTLFAYTQAAPDPGPTPWDAPLLAECLLDGYQNNTCVMPGPGFVPPPFCGSIENNGFLAFWAKYSSITFQFTSSGCFGTPMGTGIQAQIYAIECSGQGGISYLAAVSDCHDGGLGQPFTLTASNLGYGQVYYIMIDGWAGDCCDYQIDIIDFTPFPPSPPPAPPYITGPSPVTAGQMATYTVQFPMGSPIIENTCDNQFFYCPGIVDTCLVNLNQPTWTVPPGAIIVSQNPISITVIWGNTGGEVCVSYPNTCGGSLDICIEVVVLPLLEVFEEVYVCPGDEYEFNGMLFSAPGSYVIDLQDGTPPDSVLYLTVLNYPIMPVEETAYLCNGECYASPDGDLCDPGVYLFTAQDANGCEVPLILTLLQDSLACLIASPDTLSPGANIQLSYSLTAGDAANVQILWQGSGIDPQQAQSATPEVDAPGWYYLTVTDTLSACLYTDTAVVWYSNANCGLYQYPLPFSDSLSGAPLFCAANLSPYCSTTAGYTADTLATDTLFNGQWMRIQPCESEVAFEAFVYNCADNAGLEFRLYFDPDGTGANLQAVGPAVALNNGAIETLVFNGLSPGAFYTLAIEGLTGDECEFQLTHLYGLPPNTDILAVNELLVDGYIDGPTIVCPFIPVDYTLIPPVCEWTISANNGDCPIAYQQVCGEAPDSILWVFPSEFDTVWTIPGTAQFLSDSVGSMITVWFTDTIGGTITAEIVPVAEDTIWVEGSCYVLCGGVVVEDQCPRFFTIDVDVYYEIIELPPIGLCPGECFDFCGEVYCGPGIYSCWDSCTLLIQPAFENPPLELFLFQTVCEGDCLDWNGETYCAPGIYTWFGTSWTGCDSLVHLQLEVIPLETVYHGLVQLCEGECYAFNGQEFCLPGLYEVEVPAVPCPEIHLLEIELLPSAFTDLGTQFLCPGECFEFNGQLFCEEGPYQVPVINQFGCDDYYEFELVVLPPIVNNLGLQSLCEGECFEFDGQLYCEPGSFELSLPGQNGCPETFLFDIEVLPTVVNNLGLQSLCEGECFEFDGQLYCSNGDYQVELPGANGCLELFTFQLELIPVEPVEPGPVTVGCDDLSETYSVSVDLAGLQPPVFVNGQPVGSGTYTLSGIPSGASYQLEIADSSPCSLPAIVAGSHDCPCISDFGGMSQMPLFGCPGTSLQAQPTGSPQLDGNDLVRYVLHTQSGSALGAILQVGSSPTVAYDPSLNFGVTYYLSQVVGSGSNGQLDWNDACLAVSPGQPVIFYPAPELSITSPPLLTCSQPQAMLQATITGGSPSLEINWLFNGQQLGSGANLSATEAGVYELVVDDQLTGCSASATVLVEADQTPPDLTLDLGSFTCNDPVATLTALVAGDVEVEWQTPDGDQLTGAVQSVDLPGPYSCTATGANGCTSTQTFELVPAPSGPTGVEWTQSPPRCFGIDDGELSIQSVISGTPPYLFQLDGQVATAQPLFTSLAPGAHDLTVVDALGCEWTESVDWEYPEALQLDLGPNLSVPLGTMVELSPSLNFLPATVEWAFDGQFQPDWTDLEVSFQAMESAYIEVMAADEFGCAASGGMQLEVIDDRSLFVPNIFSPNGDGQNDYFLPQAGPQVARFRDWKIFDRWGGLVFQRQNTLPEDDPTKGWDGRRGGSACAAGAYVYVLEVEYLDGRIEIVKGDVTLVR